MIEDRLAELHDVKLTQPVFERYVIESPGILSSCLCEQAPGRVHTIGSGLVAAVDDRLARRCRNALAHRRVSTQEGQDVQEFGIEAHRSPPGWRTNTCTRRGGSIRLG